MLQDKSEEVSRADVIGMKKPAVLIAYSVSLHAPPQEGGLPGTEEVGPGEAEGDEEHAK